MGGVLSVDLELNFFCEPCLLNPAANFYKKRVFGLTFYNHCLFFFYQYPLETSWHGNQIRLGQMSDPKDTAGESSPFQTLSGCNIFFKFLCQLGSKLLRKIKILGGVHHDDVKMPWFLSVVLV